MRISQFLNQKIYVANTVRGFSIGIGFSLKTQKITQLLCCAKPSSDLPPTTDFAVNPSAVSNVDDGIFLSILRACLPKNQPKLFLNLPVYGLNGVFLGNLIDGEMENFTLIQLCTDKNVTFLPSEIAVCGDAILLRKKAPFPIGQRVPSPLLSHFQGDSVTKKILKRAIENGSLIKLTLSLSPFSILSNS